MAASRQSNGRSKKPTGLAGLFEQVIGRYESQRIHRLLAKVAQDEQITQWVEAGQAGAEPPHLLPLLDDGMSYDSESYDTAEETEETESYPEPTVVSPLEALARFRSERASEDYTNPSHRIATDYQVIAMARSQAWLERQQAALDEESYDEDDDAPPLQLAG